MRYLVDIDSALVSQARRGKRQPIAEAIDKAKALIAEGHSVVLWSKHGLKYARRFAADNGLSARVQQKPDALINRF